jgi:hypothetical protein
MPKWSLRCNKDFSSKTVLFIILAGDFPFDFPQDLSKLIESLLECWSWENSSSLNIKKKYLFLMVENICLVLDAHHEYTAFLQFERNVFKQSQRNWPSYSW